MEHKRHQTVKAIMRKENKGRSLTAPDLMARKQQERWQHGAAKTQTHWPTVQRTGPVNKITRTWSGNIWQGSQEHSLRKGQPLRQMMLENWTNVQKNETGPLSYTNHNNELKMIKALSVRPETTKLLEENRGEAQHWSWQWGFEHDTKRNRRKTQQEGPCQT